MNRREFCLATTATAAGAVSLCAQPATDGPPTEQLRMSSGLPAGRLEQMLLPRAQWRPFPTAAERTEWDLIPADARQALVARGEAHLGKEWPVLPATLFLEFAREGNRSRYEALRNRRRDAVRELAIAECVEGRGRFLDELVNGIWTTCEETYWGVPAHVGVQKAGKGLPDADEPTVDLFAAETASLLAWIYYLLGPKLDEQVGMRARTPVSARIESETRRRVLEPCRLRDDFSWMGFGGARGRVNNWNPWINSNWLTATLLLEDKPAPSVAKIVRSLDRFLDAYHEDGGCDEGPGYWGRAGGSLFDCLELLYSASKGTITFYEMPLVREIGRYIYRAHIVDDWFTNFGDAAARTRIAADLVYRYGKRIGDERMETLGALAGVEQEKGGGGSGAVRGESIGRQLAALFRLAEFRAAGAVAAREGKERLLYVRDVWLPGTQVMAARVREGSAEGFYMAAQGGHNAESHNHNDVGNFVVFLDGKPVFVDAGVETYSARTFSAERYSIWTMQSAWHMCRPSAAICKGRVRRTGRRSWTIVRAATARRFRWISGGRMALRRVYGKCAGRWNSTGGRTRSGSRTRRC
ncbi:MAG: heparinase II/III family protein [Bryobacteraceae bacterium]